jgi:hypothetical protein
MPFDIQPQFKQLGNQALDNYDKDAVPRFPGNEAVPIQANISPEKLISALQDSASGSSGVHSEAKQTLESLASEYHGWNISAGIHEGGLGGGGFAADPNKHITLSTGQHVQLNDAGVIKRITGNGIEDRRTQNTGPSATEQRLAGLQNQYGLNPKEASKALLLAEHGNTDRNFTEAQAAEEIISRRKK